VTTIQDLETRITGVEAAVINAIADLNGRVDALQPPDFTGTAPPPLRFADRADTDAWADLVDWVDDLNRGYSISPDYQILPCWPAHPGMVEELAALHSAWIAAAISDSKNGPHPAEPADNKKPAKPARPAKGGPDYAVWHDRALWPFLDRIRDNRYRIHMCTRNNHVPETAEDLPPATDRLHIPGI